MKIDPTTSSLFTDAGDLLKTLHCPLNKSWGEMSPVDNGSKICDSCSRKVFDTANLSDNDIVLLLINDPDACLKVSPTQANYSVLPVSMQGLDNAD